MFFAVLKHAFSVSYLPFLSWLLLFHSLLSKIGQFNCNPVANEEQLHMQSFYHPLQQGGTLHLCGCNGFILLCVYTWWRLSKGGNEITLSIVKKKKQQQRQERMSNKLNSLLSKLNCSFPSSLNLLNLGECSWVQLFEGRLLLVNMGLKFNPGFFLEHPITKIIADWLNKKNETEFILLCKPSIARIQMSH